MMVRLGCVQLTHEALVTQLLTQILRKHHNRLAIFRLKNTRFGTFNSVIGLQKKNNFKTCVRSMRPVIKVET